MNRPKKKYFLEASFAFILLVILFQAMFPKFLKEQKYGPISSHVDTLLGNWKWDKRELCQLDSRRPSCLWFRPVTEQGELSLKVINKIENGQIFAMFQNEDNRECFLWNFSEHVERYRQINNFLNFLPEDPFHFPIRKTLGQDTVYSIRFSLLPDSQNLEGYVDGVKVMQYSFPSKVSGRFGVCTENTIAVFKDIKISPIE